MAINVGHENFVKEVNGLIILELPFKVFAEMFIYFYGYSFLHKCDLSQKVMRCFLIKARIILYRHNLFNILFTEKIMKYVQESITFFIKVIKSRRKGVEGKII